MEHLRNQWRRLAARDDKDPYFGFYKRPRTIEERDESGRWHRASLLIDDETGL